MPKFSSETFNENFADPPSRLVVELGNNGDLIAEYYINGSRQRETLPQGFETYNIKEILTSISNSRAAARARNEEILRKLKAKEQKSVHIRFEQELQKKIETRLARERNLRLKAKAPETISVEILDHRNLLDD